MSLKERTYSILIVSATDVLTSAFAGLLPETRYSPVLCCFKYQCRQTLRLQKRRMILLSLMLLCTMIWGVRLAIDISSSKQVSCPSSGKKRYS
mgnify:CR=1 FL=1